MNRVMGMSLLQWGHANLVMYLSILWGVGVSQTFGQDVMSDVDAGSQNDEIVLVKSSRFGDMLV